MPLKSLVVGQNINYTGNLLIEKQLQSCKQKIFTENRNYWLLEPMKTGQEGLVQKHRQHSIETELQFSILFKKRTFKHHWLHTLYWLHYTRYFRHFLRWNFVLKVGANRAP